MLNSIKITNSFAHKDFEHHFKAGMTTITGPNGRGKSEILTMIRFALFGAAALPTSTTDYKGTRVELAFRVRDVAHRVERTTSQAKLWRGPDLIATGTKPVNLKVVEVFGYGLAVFDTANVANQGLIEALGAMLPAERKRLVDSTIGLNVIDDLARWCADEAALLNRERQGIEGTVQEPEAPVRPEGYRDGLEIEREVLVKLDTERADLARRIATVPELPAVMECTESRTVAELEVISKHRSELSRTAQDLCERINRYPHPQYTAEQLDVIEAEITNWDTWKAAKDFVKKAPRPQSVSRQFVLDELHYHDRYDAWLRHEELRKQGSHTCPSCDYKWAVRQEDMEEIRKVAKLPLSGLIEPTSRRETLNTLLRLWDAYDASFPERIQHECILELHPDPPPRPTINSLLVIQKHRLELENLAIRESLFAQRGELLDELDYGENVTEELIHRRAYEKALEHLARAIEARSHLPEWEARLTSLQEVPARLTALLDLQVACQTYDRLQAAYTRQMADYEKVQARVADLVVKAAGYTAAKLALAEIKLKVKTHLVPSLSRVASVILSRMTGGALSRVAVDPDFDIRVDDKPMAGLSGAGKAAANLALRIGLGQVLTNRVFSVFMGDELDASMDEDRARFMAESLRNLSSTVGQIVLVSHKRPEADHYIQL